MTALLPELPARHGVDSVGICRYEDCLPLIPCRAVSRLPESPHAVIVCLFPYYTVPLPKRNVSRYAAVDDYHGIAGAILKEIAEALEKQNPGHRFVPFVDASPIREVGAARLCGLGDVGRNGLLLHPVYGSCVFIGTVVTDLALPPTGPPGGLCEGCGACVRACPTGALSEKGFQKALCRSHITQKTGELTDWEAAQIRLGGMVWGCDHCQDACPHNKNLPLTPIEAFRERVAPVLTAENLDALYHEKPYNYRNKKLLLRNLSILDGRGEEY